MTFCVIVKTARDLWPQSAATEHAYNFLLYINVSKKREATFYSSAVQLIRIMLIRWFEYADKNTSGWSSRRRGFSLDNFRFFAYDDARRPDRYFKFLCGLAQTIHRGKKYIPGKKESYLYEWKQGDDCSCVYEWWEVAPIQLSPTRNDRSVSSLAPAPCVFALSRRLFPSNLSLHSSPSSLSKYTRTAFSGDYRK